MEKFAKQVRVAAENVSRDWEQRLRQLVEVDCGTHNIAGVTAVGERFAAWLKEDGFHVEHIPVDGCAGVWVGRLSGTGTGRIGLLGHLDTVYPDGTVAERPLRREGNRLLGPGVCDMKGGLLVGLYAVRALLEVSPASLGEVVFVLNSEEETGSPHTRETMLEALEGSDAVFVLESARANGNLVSARAGVAAFVLESRGKAAHAGVEPEKGANAIVDLITRLALLQERSAGQSAYRINIGRIEGGTVSNVVPDRARAEIDVRLFTADGLSAVTQLMEEVATLPVVPGATARLTHTLWFPPMEETEKSRRLADLAKRCAASLNFSVEDTWTGGGSDANWVASREIPCLDGLGPVGGLDHSPDEYIEADSMVSRIAMLALLMAGAREAFSKGK
jgi:glutamate carboxypeptidase